MAPEVAGNYQGWAAVVGGKFRPLESKIEFDREACGIYESMYDNGDVINERLCHNARVTKSYIDTITGEKSYSEFVEDVMDYGRRHSHGYGASKLLFNVVKLMFIYGMIVPAGAFELHTPAFARGTYWLLEWMFELGNRLLGEALYLIDQLGLTGILSAIFSFIFNELVWILLLIILTLSAIYLIMWWLSTDPTDYGRIRPTGLMKIRLPNKLALEKELLKFKASYMSGQREVKLFGIFSFPHEGDIMDFNGMCEWQYVSASDYQANKLMGNEVAEVSYKEELESLRDMKELVSNNFGLDRRITMKQKKLTVDNISIDDVREFARESNIKNIRVARQELIRQIKNREKNDPAQEKCNIYTYATIPEQKAMLNSVKEKIRNAVVADGYAIDHNIYKAYVDKRYMGLSRQLYDELNELMVQGLIEIGDKRPSSRSNRKLETTKLTEYAIREKQFSITYLYTKFTTWFGIDETPVRRTMWLCDAMIDEIVSDYISTGREIIPDSIYNAASKKNNYNLTTKDWEDWGCYGPSLAMKKIIVRRLETTAFNQIHRQEVQAYQNQVFVEKRQYRIKQLWHEVARTVSITNKYVNWKLIASLLFATITIFISGILVSLHFAPIQTNVDLDVPHTFYMVENVTYGSIPYYDKQVPKNKLKHFKQIKQGNITRAPSYGKRMIVTGYNPDGLQWFDLHNQTNIDAAVTTRVALTNVTTNYDPDFSLMEKHAKQLGKEMRECIPPLEDVWSQEAFEEYINTRPQYSVQQKKQIIETGRKWLDYNWIEALRTRDARFMAFLKDECYPENKRPRNILAASEIVKYYLGAVFHQLAEVFFNREQAIKRVPIWDRPRVISERLQGDGYVYQTDHSAFEAAATEEIQQHCEQIVYNICYPELKDAFKVLCEEIIFKCGYAKDESETVSMYKMPCSRWSGAPNTSLGNSITNYVFIKMVEEKLDTEFKFLVEGDDGLILSPIPINATWINKYAEKNGFALKFEEKNSVCEAGFLSLIWDPDDLKPAVVDPWNQLVKTDRKSVV